MTVSLNTLLSIVMFLPKVGVTSDSHPQTLVLQAAYSALDVECHPKELMH